jgi:hypothetical protein
MIGAPDPDALAAWRAAVAANLLTLAGAAAGFIAFPSPMSLRSPLTLVRFIQIVLSTAWLTMLGVQRRRPRLGPSLAAFGLSVLPQLVLVWVTGAAHEAEGHGWEPFLRQKVLFILFGVMGVRQYWVGLVMIAGFMVDVCLEYWVAGIRFSPHITPDEPWVTLAFGVGCGILAVARGRQMTHERRVVEAQRDNAGALRLAHVALAVRDLANTPLQTIELNLWMLERRHEELDLAPIRRAVARLEQLQQILGEYEPPQQYSPADESFDAAEVLRRPRPS